MINIGRKRDTVQAGALGLADLYNYFFDRLKELSLSCFKWENLPETVDPVYMEEALFDQGKAVFYYDENMEEYVALRCSTNGGGFNAYGIPIRRRAYGYNGYNETVDITNSVIIFNNMLRTPAFRTCQLFARQLSRIAATIDVNINAQKTPVLILGTEQQQLTLKNLYLKWDCYSPVIFGDKNLDISGFQVLRTDAPFIAPELKDLFDRYWNEALTYLGIPNLTVQKRERLIRDEVLRTQGGTVASRNSRLKARERACELINEMFGLDISVSYNDALDDMEGGADDGGLYNTGQDDLRTAGGRN